MRIVIYALGGGWGHLTRAISLAGALPPALILTNSPYAGIISAAMPQLVIEAVVTRQQAVRRIEEIAPRILIVDTFPRGLGGELTAFLAKCPARKVLIHRDLAPDYIEWAANLPNFVATHYDLILCPGESGPFSNLPEARLTSPWLVRPPVPVPNQAPVVVCAAGNVEELSWYGEVCSFLSTKIEFQCLAAERPAGCPRGNWICHWPAIDFIAGAQVVIGGAGYNTVYECVVTGTPLIARPWPRKYDRQQLRAGRHPNITIVDTPSEAASAALIHRAPTPRPDFSNGALDAARLIIASR